MKPHEQTQIGHLILQAVQQQRTGKGKLAAFLKGSKSQVVKKLTGEVGYGALYWFDILTIKSFITQLEGMEFITTYTVRMGDYSYPTLILTEAGKKVLEEKKEISLQRTKEIKPITMGDSEKETLALFKKGCNPQEIAKRRGLAVSTIFGHLYTLIVVGELSATQCVSDIVINKIMKAKRSFRYPPTLKELKQNLPEEIRYEEIRIVLGDKGIQ
jgi:DNA-binding CsgD family transcriptional regulator